MCSGRTTAGPNGRTARHRLLPRRGRAGGRSFADAEQVLDVELVHAEVVFKKHLELCVLRRPGDPREALSIPPDEEKVLDLSMLNKLGVVGGDDDLLLLGGV